GSERCFRLFSKRNRMTNVDPCAHWLVSRCDVSKPHCCQAVSLTYRRKFGKPAPRLGATSLAFESLLRFGDLVALLVVDGRVAQIESGNFADDNGGHGRAAHPFVIGRDNVPGGPFRAGGLEHLFVGFLVVFPEGALGNVRRRKLPVLL